MDRFEIVDVTMENAEKETFFCVKNIKDPGFRCKQSWLEAERPKGLRLKILKNEAGKMSGFIEYVPAEYAWRPVQAEGYMFIHCMFIYPNSEREKGNATALIRECERDAIGLRMKGVCVMTSDGTWITDKRIFEKNGYTQTDEKERFELMVKKFEVSAPDPFMIDWAVSQKNYQGWHLLYADQCPWHEKSAMAIRKVAEEHGIELKIKKITSSREAKNSPSGFGVFALIKDGRLLEDHYISETRFRNILKKFQ